MKHRQQLIDVVRDIVWQRNLTQKEIRDVLGISQPRVSALMNCKVSDFSEGMLLKYLFKLGWKLDFKYKDGVFSAKAKAV